MFKEKFMVQKLVVAVALILVAVLSMSAVTKYATNPENHAGSIEMLDEKRATALKLTAAVAATSSAISLLPGDAATPIAEELSELTTPLLIVVCAIYLEKFLLTTIGYLSFKIIVPIACLLGAIYLFWAKGTLRSISIKLMILAISVYCIIPVSVEVMQLIETTFEGSISETMDTVDEISDEAKESAETGDASGFMGFIGNITDSVSNFTDKAKEALGVFVDAIAVLVITTCVIPIAVVFLFIWIIKLVLGVNIPLPKGRMPHGPYEPHGPQGIEKKPEIN